MEWKSRMARSCVLGLLPTILILAGCSTLRGVEREPMAGKTASAKPAEERLIQPSVQSPKVAAEPEMSKAEPEMPKVASRTPNPRDSATRKPATPPKRPPLPKLAEPVVVAPADLVGLDFSSVLQVLRKPDTVQSSALSIVWTYSEPNCTLQLFFYPDIQTKIFRLLKHDLKSVADGAAERNACMRDIMVVKNDEPASP
jgi:hypothetical protein